MSDLVTMSYVFAFICMYVRSTAQFLYNLTLTCTPLVCIQQNQVLIDFIENYGYKVLTNKSNTYHTIRLYKSHHE